MEHTVNRVQGIKCQKSYLSNGAGLLLVHTEKEVFNEISLLEARKGRDELDTYMCVVIGCKI
jgi:hypothetical protein